MIAQQSSRFVPNSLHFFLVILIKVHLELDKFFHILEELKEGGSGFKFLAALGEGSLAEGLVKEGDIIHQFEGGIFPAELLGASFKKAG